MNTISIETTPARTAEVPRGQILLESPPELPDAGGDGMTQALVYLPMAAMAVGTAVMLAGGHAGPVSYVGAGAVGIGMAGMMAGQLARRHSDRKLKLSRLRRDYLRYLSKIRARARASAGPISSTVMSCGRSSLASSGISPTPRSGDRWPR